MKGFQRAAATLVVLLLAGCTTTVRGTGTAPPAAGQLVVAAIDGLRDADTGFALSVSAAAGSRAFEATTRTRGDNGTGTLTVDGVTAELRNVDGDGYVKAPTEFWTDYVRLDDDVAQELDGRWVVIAAAIVNLMLYVSQPAMAQSLTTYATDTTFRLVGREEIDGTPARRIDAADGSTAAISVERPQRLLEIGSEQGEFGFSYPTDDVSVTAPDDPVPFPS